MKYLLIIPAIFFLLAVTACNSGNGNNVVDADSTSVPLLSPEEQRMNDSLDSIAALPPSVLRNDVTTPEQADSFMRQSGYWAEYSSGVIDTIAKQNIDYANRLLHNQEPYFLVADKQHMMVVLYNKFGQPHRAYKMACSAQFGTKHARRDNRTPEGFFSAEGIYDSTEWLFTDDDGNTSEKRGQFGPRFIRIKGAPDWHSRHLRTVVARASRIARLHANPQRPYTRTGYFCNQRHAHNNQSVGPRPAGEPTRGLHTHNSVALA